MLTVSARKVGVAKALAFDTRSVTQRFVATWFWLLLLEIEIAACLVAQCPTETWHARALRFRRASGLRARTVTVALLVFKFVFSVLLRTPSPASFYFATFTGEAFRTVACHRFRRVV